MIVIEEFWDITIKNKDNLFPITNYTYNRNLNNIIFSLWILIKLDCNVCVLNLK